MNVLQVSCCYREHPQQESSICMAVITQARVLDALRAVRDPDLHRDIVTLDFVKEVTLDGNAVSVHIELTTPACHVRDELKAPRNVQSVMQFLRWVKSECRCHHA